MRKITLSLLLLSLYISGCTPIMTAISDEPVAETKTNRSLGERIDDRVLRSKAIRNIAAEARLEAANIEVYSHEGQILLIGQVPSKDLLATAEQAVQPLRDLRSLKNLLSVGDNTSLLQSSKDKFIASKLKAKLLLNDEYSVGNIKLAVENGEAYLFGLATRSQAELAINLAKETSGVKTVVTAINYVKP